MFKNMCCSQYDSPEGHQVCFLNFWNKLFNCKNAEFFYFFNNFDKKHFIKLLFNRVIFYNKKDDSKCYLCLKIKFCLFDVCFYAVLKIFKNW